MKQKIIVLTRCKNESRNLPEFLDICESISDGVLFLDDHSSDNCLDIAKNHNGVLRAWDSYTVTNDHIQDMIDWIALLSAAQCYDPDWVLLLDVDERLDPVQFNNHKEKLLDTDANAINLMWPFFNEITNKYTYWGWGPNNDKNKIKIKFKTNIFLRYKDILPIDPKKFNTKPVCKNPKTIYTNLVLKHLSVRPAKERLYKWDRRLPIEQENHLGYPKKYLIDHLEYLKGLDPDSPTTDKWIDNIEKEHGIFSPIDRENLIVSDKPTWEMLISHLPDMTKHKEDGKYLL